MIRSELTLDRYARGVTVTTTLVNTCEDHRLRVMFPTHLAATHSSAEEPFDVVERPIDRGPDSPWRRHLESDPSVPTVRRCQRRQRRTGGASAMACVNTR